MDVESATGYYANIFNEEGLDVFVILNEPNDEPTTDDYIFIENTVTECISKYGCVDTEVIKRILNEHFSAGVQVINHSSGYAKL